MQEGVDCTTRPYNYSIQVIRGVSKSPVREETGFALPSGLLKASLSNISNKRN